MIKGLVHKLTLGELKPEQMAHLRGWIAHLRSVEPSFVVALQRKYELDLDANETWLI